MQGAILVFASLFFSLGAQASPVEVRGYHGERAAGADFFPNIAYAKPPVGRFRWRRTEPEALPRQRSAAVSCPQEIYGQMSGQRDVSEDCLYLNLYAPETPGPHPVVVFIHGGGLTSGTGLQSMYDGSVFARRGIVFVSFNYRLGELGYGPTLEKRPGSPGVMDQLLALQWVKKNIAGFGGDPGRIFLMGQSKGAEAVVGLLESGEADVAGGIAFTGARNFSSAMKPNRPPEFLPGEEALPWNRLLELRKNFLYLPYLPQIRETRTDAKRFPLLATNLYDERFSGQPNPVFCANLHAATEFYDYLDTYLYVLHSPGREHGDELLALFSQSPFGGRILDLIVGFLDGNSPEPYRKSGKVTHLFPRFSFAWPASSIGCDPFHPGNSSLGPGWRFLERISGFFWFK